MQVCTETTQISLHILIRDYSATVSYISVGTQQKTLIRLPACLGGRKFCSNKDVCLEIGVTIEDNCISKFFSS